MAGSVHLIFIESKQLFHFFMRNRPPLIRRLDTFFNLSFYIDLVHDLIPRYFFRQPGNHFNSLVPCGTHSTLSNRSGCLKYITMSRWSLLNEIIRVDPLHHVRIFSGNADIMIDHHLAQLLPVNQNAFLSDPSDIFLPPRQKSHALITTPFFARYLS